MPMLLQLTDEQRVVLWLALRMSNRELDHPNRVTYTDIHRQCGKTWEGAGVWRDAETWGRAFRRAKREGMLGTVKQIRIPGKRYEAFEFSADVDDLLVAVGPGYTQISHGNVRLK